MIIVLFKFKQGFIKKLFPLNSYRRSVGSSFKFSSAISYRWFDPILAIHSGVDSHHISKRVAQLHYGSTMQHAFAYCKYRKINWDKILLFCKLNAIMIYTKVYIEHEEEAFILNSIPSIIMIVLEFGNDTGKSHNTMTRQHHKFAINTLTFFLIKLLVFKYSSVCFHWKKVSSKMFCVRSLMEHTKLDIMPRIWCFTTGLS